LEELLLTASSAQTLVRSTKNKNNGERRQQEISGRVKDEEGNKLLGKSRTRVCAFNVQSVSLSLTHPNRTFSSSLGNTRQFNNATVAKCTQNYGLHMMVYVIGIFADTVLMQKPY
jgi:hypothetical protein